MATEPYWAEAPSRSTSTEPRATEGMVFRSKAVDPRPRAPFTLTKAPTWPRCPLISTRVWSGARPRRVAGRTWSEPSEMAGRGKLIDGAAAARAAAVSVPVPLRVRVSPVITSTGAIVSRRVRPMARVPVTTISPMSAASSAGVASWAKASGADISALVETKANKTERPEFSFMTIPKLQRPVGRGGDRPRFRHPGWDERRNKLVAPSTNLSLS